MSENNDEIKEQAPVETPEVKPSPGPGPEATGDRPQAAPAPAPAFVPRTTGRPEFRDRQQGGRPRRTGFYDSSNGKDRESGSSESARVPRFKRKMCSFCQDKNLQVDYKRPDILERFITDRGKILPRRVTGTCSKHQRSVAREIKRARIISLLPFVEQ